MLFTSLHAYKYNMHIYLAKYPNVSPNKIETSKAGLIILHSMRKKEHISRTWWLQQLEQDLIIYALNLVLLDYPEELLISGPACLPPLGLSYLVASPTMHGSVAYAVISSANIALSLSRHRLAVISGHLLADMFQFSILPSILIALHHFAYYLVHLASNVVPVLWRIA